MVKAKKEETKKESKADRYFEGIGGRKTATARARVFPKGKNIVINGKDFKEYFKDGIHQEIVIAPFEALKGEAEFGATIQVSGGGLTGQAEAVRHGIARALVKFNEDYRKRMKKPGFLTRDARMVERKKYGLKKARRAPQWAKR